LGLVYVGATPLTAMCSFSKLSCTSRTQLARYRYSCPASVPAQTPPTLPQSAGFAATDGERCGVNVGLVVKDRGSVVCSMRSDSGPVESHNAFTSSFRHAGRSVSGCLQACALDSFFLFFLSGRLFNEREMSGKQANKTASSCFSV